MNSFFFNLLQAATGTEAAPNPILTFLPLVAIIGIFYFLIIRPQSKKQKETQKMLSALKKGDKIVTIGGIHGVIQTVRENSVIVKVDETTKLEFSRSAISSITAQGKEEKDEKKSGEISDKSSEDKSDDKSSDEKKE